MKLTSVCLSIQLAGKAENQSVHLAGEAYTSLLSVQLAGKAENLSLYLAGEAYISLFVCLSSW